MEDAKLFMKGEMTARQFRTLQARLESVAVSVPSPESLSIGSIDFEITTEFGLEPSVAKYLKQCGVSFAYIYFGDPYKFPSANVYDAETKTNGTFVFDPQAGEFLLPLDDAEDEHRLVAARTCMRVYDDLSTNHAIQPRGAKAEEEFQSSKPHENTVREDGVEAIVVEVPGSPVPSLSFETIIYTDRTDRRWVRMDDEYKLLVDDNRLSLNDDRTK